ncbi:response regulator [Nocardioides mangrovi]|uniref:Response regulator n=1 Tax=Nocardioides mangrovi TaxID=2874580 RepID=A0ABS7U890_9ACTN|nr:response regulator [Nocardioides mangrovi]MBZ5737042.1 response regulator [Nocardioides mangrovi]
MSDSGVVTRPVALVIEDDPDVSDLLDLVLTQAGFTVHTAASGAEGVELAREHRPILATIDVQMPQMDGLEATRRIREFSSTYIVIVSTRSQESDVLAGFEAGADDYVTKPIRPRELRARLAAVARRPPTELLAGTAPAWEPAQEDAERAQLLREISEGAPAPIPDEPEPVAEVDETAPAPEGGQDGRDGMLEVGMRFVGGWVDFRGLRINPARGLVVVDDRTVELPPTQVTLLETLMYAGTRVLTSRQIGLRLRHQTEETSTSTKLQDERMVAGLVDGLRVLLGESIESPRWFEELSGTRYRLVRPDGTAPTGPGGQVPDEPPDEGAGI